jgi:effector-binding domain-containing protein/ribosome-associated toxin RatA of RatAB toxin-antitoxin module
MKLLKGLVVFVLLVAAAAFGYGMTLPNTMHFERSTLIAAPPCTVYAQIDNFRNFNKWSPWQQYDPQMQNTIEGPPIGVGARQTWSGNAQVGTGTQEIVEVQRCRMLKSRLAFGGFEDNRYLASFALAPAGEATEVTWSLDGEFGGGLHEQVLSRYFARFAGDMVARDYETGLANLRALVEKLPKGDFATLVVEQVNVEPVAVAAVNGRSSTESAEIGRAYAEAFARIMGFMKANDLAEAGPPIAITRKWDEPHQVFEFDAAIPVNRSDVAPAAGEVRMMQTYGGKVLKVTHTGPYEGLANTYAMLKSHVAAYGYEKAADEWEQYVSDPGQTPAEALMTVIYYPVK